MSNSRIGVGIIGVNPERGWARMAHVPALNAVSDSYELVAVSSTRLASAQQAAQVFGARQSFDSHVGLIGSDEVDLVVVTVKVPAHYELVEAALKAGKQVYCEWPLGNGLGEAEALATLARERSIRTIVGLQGRASPGVRFLRDLIGDGYVGEILSMTILGSGMYFGPYVMRDNIYAQDYRNGASLLTIPFGHTMDALGWAVGELDNITARMAVLFPQVPVRDLDLTNVNIGQYIERGEVAGLTAEMCERTCADEIAVLGSLRNNAIVSAYFGGGVSAAENLRIEIRGTKGDLLITGNSGHMQYADLKFAGTQGAGSMAPIDVPPRYTLISGMSPGPAVNVAGIYRLFAESQAGIDVSVPDFEDAVIRHRFIDNVEQAAAWR